jgi:hypothetical protein
MPAPVSLQSHFPVTPAGGDPTGARQIRTTGDAAAAFEALLLKQLLGAMSKTAGEGGMFGGGFEGQMYGDMFSTAVAEQAAGSGLGLSAMIREALGVDERGPSATAVMANRALGLGRYRAEVSGEAAPPANPYLARVAGDWLSGDASARWGVDGVLQPQDLPTDIATQSADGGTAVFNVKDAQGYAGSYKCNLFAFEMVRRTGYTVPLRAREHGWGYPGADVVARMAAGEHGVADWAEVRSSASAPELDARARSGQPYVLASSAPGDAMGHMVVADRIHSIERDGDGRIAVLEFSGWQAGGSGASYGRHVWRRMGVPGEGRGGLDDIEILEPHWAGGAEPYRALDRSRPGASVLDKPAPLPGAQENPERADVQDGGS